jgi:flagellar motor switch protein FliG
MSQETLYTLFGLLLIALLVFVGGLAIEKVASIISQINQAIRLSTRRRLESMNDTFRKEVDRMRTEIEPKFDLWWSETGKKVIESNKGVYAKLGLPIDFSELPELEQSMISHQTLDTVSEEALKFAVHVANQPAHNTFIKEVRRVSNAQAEAFQEEYQMHMERHRRGLAGLGIDVDEFEAQFSTI